ncbi:hypothetical protein LXL04_002649 [Taraxacum kok-saghyz]
MWLLHILLNKLLKKLKHEDREEEHNVSFTEAYDFKTPTKIWKYNIAVVSRLHCVEVPHIQTVTLMRLCSCLCLNGLRTLNFHHFDIQYIEDPCCTTKYFFFISYMLFSLCICIALKYPNGPGYPLQKLSIRISYCTVTIENTSSFSVDTFYKEESANDMLFQRLVEEGIKITCMSIKVEETIFVFPGKYVFTVLVDRYPQKYVDKYFEVVAKLHWETIG